MCPTQETVKRFSSATKLMKQHTKPLSKQGIEHFSMIRSFDDGRFVNLSNIDGWIDYYYQQRLYLSSCFENHPSKYSSQIYLWQDKLKGNVVKDAKKHFDSSNGVTIIDRRFNYTSFYFFSSTPEKTDLDNFYINNLNYLHEFIHQFNQTASELIASCVSNERHYIYDAFYVDNPLPNNALSGDASLLNKNELRELKKSTSCTQDLPKITPKESECLSWLLKGLSVKEIANKKSMSPRTVEHHINSLKTKFGCRSSLGLISTLYTDYHHLALSLLHVNYA